MIPKRISVCSMIAALCLVLMLLGSFLGIGMYAVPMIVGLLLTVPGEKYGWRSHLLLWAAVGILSLILVPEMEQSLMFLLIFGPYPMLYPLFQKCRLLPRILLKLLYFNGMVILTEAIVMAMLFPDGMGTLMAAMLLLLGNLLFFCYDHLIPRAERLMQRYLGKLYDRL